MSLLIAVIGFASSTGVAILKKEHLKELTTDFGIVHCWSYRTAKYVVIDIAGDFYAVNGSARGISKKSPDLEWRDSKLILKPGGKYVVFSDIIQYSIKNGCSPLSEAFAKLFLLNR